MRKIPKKLRKYLLFVCAVFIAIWFCNIFKEDIEPLKKESYSATTNKYSTTTTVQANLTEMQKAIQEVAYAYYMRGENIQYNSMKVGFYSPEESTTQNINYMVCSGFTRNMYNELLGIKIPSGTTELLKYGKEFVGNPEVIGYGKMEDQNFIMKMYDLYAENNYIELKNPSLTDIIPYIRIGDVLTYTGHTFMVYDVMYDNNGNVVDAWIMESAHGKGKNYILTKIPKLVSIGNNISFGNANHYLYHNTYENTSWEYGLTQGSLNVTQLSTYPNWVNINTSSRCDEYSILRFIGTDKDGNAILNYQGANYNDSNHDGEIIELSDKIKDRVKYSRLYIEKTVDVNTDDIVETNDELTYTIIIKNNSDNNYNEDIIVSENISKYVTYKSYTSNKSSIVCSQDLDNDKISWNIGKLSSGEKVSISYTVKVKKNNNGKIIESTGTVANIPSSVVKDTIGINLNVDQANSIEKEYENLRNKYNGKKLIKEIYRNTFGIDLKFDEFKATDLINNTKNTLTFSTISLNENNNLYGAVLNKYWNTLALKHYTYEKENDISAYDLKYWRGYTSDARRQDTIYSENFKTGDILIYTNYNDVKYTYKNGTLITTPITYENGEYTYIYIDGKGFVGVNLGDDGIAGTKDDRNEFNAKYYSVNGLSVYSNTSETDEGILEFANYQSLFGKDYYVILRPSLSIDLIDMELDINYSTLNQTNKDVTVTITSNEKMLGVEGWILSEDELTLTKVYKENITEEVEIYDYLGNKTTKTIKINNIDKVAPTVEVNYSTTENTNKNVTVTIIANEEIQELADWKLASDKKSMTKTYSANTEETIIVKDLAGNTVTAQIQITNIDKIAPIAQVNYSTIELINNSVIVTITANEKIQQIEGWAIDSKQKILTKIFTTNDEETVTITDLAGNTSTIDVKVTNIDKTEIEADVKYSTTIWTNKDVTVTITLNKAIKEIENWKLSEDGKTLTKVFTSNEEKELEVQDLAGNTKKLKVSVANIDKTAPIIDVSYNIISATNKDVIVIITANEEIQKIEGWTLSEDGKALTKTYSTNKEETIILQDIAGNTIEANIKITNIDKEKPKVDVNYSTTELTKGNVIITIIADKEVQKIDGWVLSDDKKSMKKVYRQNTRETITIVDLYGNSTNVEISILNIEKNNNNTENKSNNVSESTQDKQNAQTTDNTTAKEILPKAGENKILSIIGIFIFVGFASFMRIKLKQYKDI